MALQMADAACQGLAARVASAAAPSRRHRSALLGAQSLCGAGLPRAVKKRDLSKAACTQQLKCPAASEDDAVVQDDKELTAKSNSIKRRLSFSRALDLQVSELKQEPTHATACDAMRASPEDLKAYGLGNQQSQDAVTTYVCDACGKRYAEEQYHELATICTCNHMISVVEGNLPESTAADAVRPKSAKRRRVPERTKTPSSLPRTNSTQSEPSQGAADMHEASGVGSAATASPQVTSSAPTLAHATGLKGKRGRGCSEAKASQAHAETSTPQQLREFAQKQQPPQQQSQEPAKKRGRPPKPTLEKVSAATAAAPWRRSFQSPQIPAQQLQVVEPQLKPKARAKASNKPPAPGAGKWPTTPQDLPRGLPKAAQRYLAMKPRARNQYLKGLSDAQQLRLAMQVSEAGANSECS